MGAPKGNCNACKSGSKTFAGKAGSFMKKISMNNRKRALNKKISENGKFEQNFIFTKEKKITKNTKGKSKFYANYYKRHDPRKA